MNWPMGTDLGAISARGYIRYPFKELTRYVRHGIGHIMNSFRIVFRLGLLIGLGIEISISPAVAQTATPKDAQPPAPGLRKLTGDDTKRAGELTKAIEGALKADRWDEAIAGAEELLALRTRAQGPKHFETVNAEWRLMALRRVAPMPHEDRLAYQSAITLNGSAEIHYAEGRFAQAQPLFEKVLEIRRRLLTDDHPETADSYSNLGVILIVQGKYTQAEPLLEHALELHRRLLTDDHPDTAKSYDKLAGDLAYQGRYAAAQPLGEKALEISRRLLTDDHPDTANIYQNVAGYLGLRESTPRPNRCMRTLEIRRRLLTDNHVDTANSYDGVGFNLGRQGKYAVAQAMFEKALEIHRRLLSDDHPYTARSYANVASNLNDQGKYAQAQPVFERRSRSAAACSPTTTPTPPTVTTIWRSTSTTRGSTRRPSRCSKSS